MIRLLRDLATQTNILAVNAVSSVARSKEQVSGLGAVANELRALVSENRSLTDHVAALIGDVQPNQPVGQRPLRANGPSA